MSNAINHRIVPATKADYLQIIEVWEASVRATHHFLSEEWIVEHKPLILEQYLDMVELQCVKDDEDNVLAFLGTLNDGIEMLFVHPDQFRKGIGQLLIRFALDEKKTTKVEVNEDNPGARQFYETMGFEVVKRSALDGQGNPYPILHMELK